MAPPTEEDDEWQAEWEALHEAVNPAPQEGADGGGGLCAQRRPVTLHTHRTPTTQHSALRQPCKRPGLSPVQSTGKTGEGITLGVCWVALHRCRKSSIAPTNMALS